MKTKLIILALYLAASFAVAADIDYRAALKRAHDRLNYLETERRDYRKPRPELPQDLERERLQLIGQLTEDDPLWVLSRDLEADIDAFAVAPDRTPADTATLDQLKDLLAIIAGVVDVPTSRDQATRFSAALRTFILRRDVSGAIAWIKQSPK
jgi:hypothetical protein